MTRNGKIFLAPLLILAGLIALSPSPADSQTGDETKPYRGIIHTHTTFSTGEFTAAEIAKKAKEAGISIVIFTDHDLVRVKWGPPPFRNLISRTFDHRPSVLLIGVDEYYNTIEELQRENSDMVLMPGIETAPFYYITGNPLFGGATVHDWRRHLLLLGMGRDAVKNLPVQNSGLSSRYFWELLPGTLLFLIPALLSLILLPFRGFVRWTGVAIFLFGIAGAIDAHPFKSSPFSAYLGPQGARPYQEIINYADDKGGLALWAHQGSLLAKEKVGAVTMETQPHKNLLLDTVNHRGFDAIYEDRFTASNPGNEWDRHLIGYVTGQRTRPVWGYGGLDFHSERELGNKKRLTDIQNVFLLKELSEASVLRAIINGRFYVVRGYRPSRLQMDYFFVSSENGGGKGSYGDDVTLKGKPRVEFQVSTENGDSVKVGAKLVRMGKVIQTFTGSTPLKVNFVDEDPIKDPRIYYRLDAKASNSEHIITNPTFARR